jgi:hypothetical protein
MALFDFLQRCKHRYIIIERRPHFVESPSGYYYSVAPKIVIICEKCGKCKTLMGEKIELRGNMDEKSEFLFDIIANKFLEKIKNKYKID